MVGRLALLVIAAAVAAWVLHGVGGWALAVIAIPVSLIVAGALVWWHASKDREFDEIGRGLMVSGLLAVVVGLAQYAIQEQQKDRDAKLQRRQKDRDFLLSLTLQKDLTGADLPGRRLTGVRLQGKTLNGANLQRAVLRNARLAGTYFKGAKLDGARLEDAHLSYAHLQGASLSGAHLERADLKNAYLSGANLGGAHLEGATLDLAHLDNACLAGAHLQHARLSGSDLSGSVLTQADLRGTNFQFDLRPSTLDGAGLFHARVDAGTTWPDGFDADVAVAGSQPAPRASVTLRPPDLIRARVSEVTDGDTVRFEGGGLPRYGRSRLVGVNAPDLEDKPRGQEAKDFLERQLEGRTVQVQIARYQGEGGGRTLVYVWLSRRMTLNEVLLESGQARVKLERKTDIARRLAAAELRARERGIGMWQRCAPPIQQ